jgi:hypothetical protein
MAAKWPKVERVGPRDKGQVKPNLDHSGNAIAPGNRNGHDPYSTPLRTVLDRMRSPASNA